PAEGEADPDVGNVKLGADRGEDRLHRGVARGRNEHDRKEDGHPVIGDRTRYCRHAVPSAYRKSASPYTRCPRCPTLSPYLSLRCLVVFARDRKTEATRKPPGPIRGRMPKNRRSRSPAGCASGSNAFSDRGACSSAGSSSIRSWWVRLFPPRRP